MAYPSVLSTLPNPQATDRLNSPSHSSLHQSENAGIIETQTFVGTLSSVPGTLVYDIRSANSNGGGHVQTANTGGTGQTSYTKGDILVATSSSVLSKLAASSVAGQVLTVDPNQAAGVYWGPAAASTKITAQVTGVSRSVGNASALTVFFSTSILGSTLSTNNAFKFTATFNTFKTGGTGTVTVNALYGGNTVGSFVLNGATASIASQATISGYVVASSIAAQVSNVLFSAETSATGALQIFPTHQYSNSTVSSVESSATQNFLITAQYSNPDNNSSIQGGLFIVEKIT